MADYGTTLLTTRNNGGIQAAVNGTPPHTPPLSQYRVAAVKKPDRGWSIFLVNRTKRASCVQINLPETPKHPFTQYRFDHTATMLFPNDIVLPPIAAIPRTRTLKLSLPAESLSVLSENVNVASSSSVSHAASDVNQDGAVDGVDLTLVLGNWLSSTAERSEQPCNGFGSNTVAFDINRDGKLNTLDAATILSDIKH